MNGKSLITFGGKYTGIARLKINNSILPIKLQPICAALHVLLIADLITPLLWFLLFLVILFKFYLFIIALD